MRPFPPLLHRRVSGLFTSQLSPIHRAVVTGRFRRNITASLNPSQVLIQNRNDGWNVARLFSQQQQQPPQSDSSENKADGPHVEEQQQQQQQNVEKEEQQQQQNVPHEQQQSSSSPPTSTDTSGEGAQIKSAEELKKEMEAAEARRAEMEKLEQMLRKTIFRGIRATIVFVLSVVLLMWSMKKKSKEIKEKKFLSGLKRGKDGDSDEGDKQGEGQEEEEEGEGHEDENEDEMEKHAAALAERMSQKLREEMDSVGYEVDEDEQSANETK